MPSEQARDPRVQQPTYINGVLILCFAREAEQMKLVEGRKIQTCRFCQKPIAVGPQMSGPSKRGHVECAELWLALRIAAKEQWAKKREGSSEVREGERQES